MAANDPGTPTQGKHSQQAVKERLAQEEARLAEERQHAQEAMRAAQERGDIAIPRHRGSHKGLVVLLVLVALALAAYLGRAHLVQFAESHGVQLPFLAPAQTQVEPTGDADQAEAPQANDSAAPAASDATDETSVQPAQDWELSLADMAAMPQTDAFAGFSLNPELQAPIPSATTREAIENAYLDIDAVAPCSFIVLNLQSGRGMAYNAGTPFYSASAFKAPYAYYLLRNAEQGALLSDDDRDYIEASLEQSDNDAYDALHYAHDTQDYYDWLADHGIADDPATSFYPDINAVTMAQLWFEINSYLDTGSAEAAWLQELLGRTNVSFIRDGLEETDAKVWDKGGWISDEDGTAVNDAGIIEAPDKTRLLMVVLTGQDNTPDAQKRVAQLALALYNARSALA